MTEGADGPSTPRRPSSVPATVTRLLERPGQPLALSGERGAAVAHQFIDVLPTVSVHEGPDADVASAALGADAFTAGSTVVLGAAARTSAERRSRLLAHELTHVRQNGDEQAHPPFVLGAPDSAHERQAEQVAAGVARPESGPRRQPSSSVSPPGLIRRDRTPNPPAGSDGGTGAHHDAGSTSTPDAGAAGGAGSAAPTLCGPDVRQQLVDVVASTKAAYGGWSADQKEEACWALENTACGPTAWDIVEFHNSDWIYQNYRPPCASAGGSPACGQTVKVGNGCHYHGSPNYVIFGVMANLCGMWRATVSTLVWAYKHSAGNYEGSKAWALAGYDGWPTIADPGGDRNNCSPRCPTPYSGGPFTLFWYPTAPTETVTSDCESALQSHRDIRDNPPTQFGGAGF